MKLQTIFELMIQAGMKADPRGQKQINKILDKYKKKEKKLDKDEKLFFDKERKWNPYGDTRIMNGTGKEEIKTLMVGIDINTPEILLADRLREKGEKIDAIMGHHPEGRAFADLHKVLPLQVDLLANIGVPVNISEGHLSKRIDKVTCAIHSDNLFRTEQAAEILGIPLFNCHTPADNMVWEYMEKKICKREYDALEDVVNAIHKIPEYKQYAQLGNPALIANGRRDSRPGKVVASEFTGGTTGPEEFMEIQARAGVGTILTMHTSQNHLKIAKEHYINIIQCSHIASDNIGVNLMLDVIQKKEKNLKTIDVSGFMRVKRG